MTHRGVIFDLDGLILDTERMALRTFSAVGEELGFEPSGDVFRRLVGLTAESSAELLLEIYGADFPLEDFRMRAREIYSAEVERHGIPVKPGLHDLLDALREAAVPYAVATSSAADRAWWKLGQVGLHGHFETVVGGDQVARGKPAPDVFQHAAAALSLPAESCVALEDSPAGIRAAASAGMTAIMVPDLVPPDDDTRALAYAVVEDLHAARSLIGVLVGL